jgi:NADH:ubiquinone oxidoreductase subunit 4 (subunit M)|tara:strand:- start:2579 stop:2827 length:249 start_codon:yes stop_codon:yes gene_type:complete
MPVFSTCFLTLSLANAAVPLSSNFVGEFIILTSIIKNSLILVIIAGISIVLSAAYSLFLYNRICMGELNKAILNSIVIESKV